MNTCHIEIHMHLCFCRVMEGKLINTGVTSPGAAIALGLMYLK